MGDYVFIVGCGYIGARVAPREIERGNNVRALARSTQSAERLCAAGVEPVTGDLDQPLSLPRRVLADAIIYYFAAPPSTGTMDSRMETFLRAIDRAALPRRVILISTTAVYGDRGGDWVTEDDTPNPQTDRARRRLAAERSLHGWSDEAGVPVVVLRVPGIYGPGRLPVARLKNAQPVLCEHEAPWSNRVHADDLVEACLAAADCVHPGATYNVSDGNPSTMTDFFNRVADALGLERPPQMSMERAKQALTPELLSYLAESKRVDNYKMQAELGVTPRYSTLDAGLAVSVQQKGE